MTKSFHVFILILLLNVLESALAIKFSSLSHADECSLLYQFKENISFHNNSKVVSWNLNRSNCCLWDGVECRFGHVIGLDLSSSFLSGSISSNNTLFNLIHLRRLDLANNDFRSSQIPSGIGRLSQLAYLNLSYSRFSGEVPASIGNLTHLRILDLGWCALTGTIPASVSNLTRLTFLDLSANDFLIPIPTLASLSKLQYVKLINVKFDRSNNCVWLGNFPNLSYLNLRFTNLNCEIPPSIGNLTKLRELDLGYNDLIGQLPSTLTNLTRLTYVFLSGNRFSGSLPSLESCSNLTYLSLSGINFDRWKLPDWFGKLKKITTLYLDDANLFGEIPSSFFNLQNLESLYLYDNNVTVDLYLFLSLKKLRILNLNGNNITLLVIDRHTGEHQPKFIDLSLKSCNLKVIPEFLRFQDRLKYLNLDNNKIEGLIPGWVWNISKDTLIEFSVAHNLLTGFEQHSPVAQWVSLQILDLRHNKLRGLVLVPPPSATELFLSNNYLTGEIPSSICELLSLDFLDLSFNNITGSVPPCFEKLSHSLRVLSLKRNILQGTIPDIFTNESTLQIIDLSENNLEGRIPRSMDNCESLQILDLRSNSLQGTIPNKFTNGCKLMMIDLSENKLEGRIPRSLEKCESLQFLDLGHNFIEDKFPFWLGALSELHVLILRFNKFNGDIIPPRKIKVNFPKLQIVDLSYNSFSGDLPHQYFQEWSAMKEIEMNGTYMQADMWRYYYFSIQMTNKGVKTDYVKIINTFSAVDLSSNMFRGKIPDSIKTLRGVRSLNLSNNVLFGVIPPSMGNLIHLESLDLSSNNLSGILPQDLVQLNFLVVLNVSNNHLTGPIPHGKQFDTFLNNSFMGNQALCGYPLSNKCGDSEASKPPSVSLEEDTESDFPNGIDWVFILSGVVFGLVIGSVCGDHLTTKYYNWFFQRFRK